MNKMLIMAAILFLLLSCRTAYRNSGYMEVFRADSLNSVLPTEYLVLKHVAGNHPSTYDYYNVLGGGGGGGGIWSSSGDTIRLYLRYVYSVWDDMKIDTIPPFEGKDTVNNLLYLRKGDALYDITDYDAMLGFHNPATIRRVYKKMSQQ